MGHQFTILFIYKFILFHLLNLFVVHLTMSQLWSAYNIKRSKTIYIGEDWRVKECGIC